MKTTHTLLCIALAASLAACQADTPSAPSARNDKPSALETTLGDNVERSMKDAQRKLETENITLRSDDGTSHKAEISPTGDLTIDGKTIALNPEQRALLLEHRAQMIEIAHAGMDIGVQGARLAGKAVTEAIGGLFSGHPEDIEKRVEAQADGIKRSARVLCDKLPAMRVTQQRLVQAIPEFAPFAKMDDSDINDCKKDLDTKDAPVPELPPSPPPPPAPPPRTGAAAVDAGPAVVTARELFGKPTLPKPPKPAKASELVGG